MGIERQLFLLGAVVCAPAEAAAQPLFHRLQDPCVIQLLLQSIDEANDLSYTGTVSVALGLESLDRLKPSSESAGVSRSLEHRGLQQRSGSISSRSVPATWARPVCAPSP